MRITHAMKPKHFESRALDLVEGMSVAERRRLVLFLRLSGYAANDRSLVSLAQEVSRLIPNTKQKAA